MNDDNFKAAFVDGYMQATQMTASEVEARRREFRELAQSIEEARAQLIAAAIKAGLISSEEAADIERSHEARRRDIEQKLEALRGRFVPPPARAM